MIQINLIGLRKENHLNQEDMARLLGISIVSYGAKELGKKQFKCNEMFTLAKYFNKSVEDIFLPTILQNGVNKE